MVEQVEQVEQVEEVEQVEHLPFWAPNVPSRLVKLPGPTRGAAETVLIGLKSLPPERWGGGGQGALGWGR